MGICSHLQHCQGQLGHRWYNNTGQYQRCQPRLDNFSSPDTIDALDSIRGSYHHDGPFDATLAGPKNVTLKESGPAVSVLLRKKNFTGPDSFHALDSVAIPLVGHITFKMPRAYGYGPCVAKPGQAIFSHRGSERIEHGGIGEESGGLGSSPRKLGKD